MFALVQLIYGALSDYFGRRPVLFSLLIYLTATMLCIGSNSIQTLIFARGLQALGTGSAILTFAIIRDLYEGERVAKMIAYMSAVVALSPIIAPIFGGYIQHSLSWQWNFIVLFFFGSLLFIMTYYMLPETNKYRSAQSPLFKPLLSSYRKLLMDKNYMGNALSAAFAFGALFSYISGSHYVFLNLMGYSPQIFGWIFAVAAIGYVLGAFASGRLISRFGMDSIFRIGIISLVSGGMIMTLSCYYFPLNALAIVMPQLVCEFGISIVVPIAVTKALQPIPQYAGAGSALIGFLRFLLAAMGSYFSLLIRNETAMPLAVVILGFSLCSLVASAFPTYLAVYRLRRNQSC